MKKTSIFFAVIFCLMSTSSFAWSVGVNNKAWWGCILGCHSGSGLCIFWGANDADLTMNTSSLVLTVPQTSSLYVQLLQDQTVLFGQDSQLEPDVAAELGIKDPATLWMMQGQYPVIDNQDGTLTVNISYYILPNNN